MQEKLKNKIFNIKSTSSPEYNYYPEDDNITLEKIKQSFNALSDDEMLDKVENFIVRHDLHYSFSEFIFSWLYGIKERHPEVYRAVRDAILVRFNDQLEQEYIENNLP